MEMPKVIAALNQAGIRGNVKVIGGGAPVTRTLPTTSALTGMPRTLPRLLISSGV